MTPTQDRLPQNQGTTVRVDQNVMRIERLGEKFVRIPFRSVDSLVALRSRQSDRDLPTVDGMHGIHVVLLTRAGRYIGRLVGPTSGNVLLRQRQYRAIDNPVRFHACARAMVATWLRQICVVLRTRLKDRLDRLSLRMHGG